MQRLVSGMHIAEGLIHRHSQNFGLKENHKSYAMTSSQIFKKGTFYGTKNERSEAGGLVSHITTNLLKGKE